MPEPLDKRPQLVNLLKPRVRGTEYQLPKRVVTRTNFSPMPINSDEKWHRYISEILAVLLQSNTSRKKQKTAELSRQSAHSHFKILTQRSSLSPSESFFPRSSASPRLFARFEAVGLFADLGSSRSDGLAALLVLEVFETVGFDGFTSSASPSLRLAVGAEFDVFELETTEGGRTLGVSFSAVFPPHPIDRARDPAIKVNKIAFVIYFLLSLFIG